MKYVVVTGAYGGIGKGIVKRLKDNGYFIFALDKKVENKEDNVFPIECDITDISSINNAYDIIKSETTEISAIIHFAGIYYLDSLLEISEERFKKIFEVNVFGPYLLNKTFLPLLHKGSKILMTTSELATLDPLPFTGLYGITKTALDKYSYSLRMEAQLLGIYVSVIRPGAVRTLMLDTSTKELDNFVNNTKLYNVSSENFRNVVNSVEAKYITPEKLAKKVLKIIRKEKPKFNYSINRNKLLILLNIFPKRFRFWVIKKILTKNK